MSDAKLLALLALEHPDKPHTVVAKLRGTFSFVVVDTASVRLFASRDPSGTIPLNLVRLHPPYALLLGAELARASARWSPGC